MGLVGLLFALSSAGEAAGEQIFLALYFGGFFGGQQAEHPVTEEFKALKIAHPGLRKTRMGQRALEQRAVRELMSNGLLYRVRGF